MIVDLLWLLPGLALGSILLGFVVLLKFLDCLATARQAWPRARLGIAFWVVSAVNLAAFVTAVLLALESAGMVMPIADYGAPAGLYLLFFANPLAGLATVLLRHRTSPEVARLRGLYLSFSMLFLAMLFVPALFVALFLAGI